MTPAIELHSGPLRCTVLPALGGSIAGLWCGEVPVLRSAPLAEIRTARQAGSYPLVPFSNRIGHAALQWQGTSHPLLRSDAAEPHAIHGVGWQRAWSVLEQEPDFLMLAFEHRPDAYWPFAFDCSQVLRLHGNALECTLSVTNQAPSPAPLGLGWHPWFAKRPASRIAFAATGRWEMGPDQLPTHRVASHGIEGDCSALDVDHCFDGWTGAVLLEDEALRVRIESNLQRLVVFTQPAREFIAIEPVSHVNNAVNLLHGSGLRAEELGLQVLAPGESATAQMRIEVEPRP